MGRRFARMSWFEWFSGRPDVRTAHIRKTGQGRGVSKIIRQRGGPASHDERPQGQTCREPRHTPSARLSSDPHHDGFYYVRAESASENSAQRLASFGRDRPPSTGPATRLRLPQPEVAGRAIRGEREDVLAVVGNR